MIHCLIDMVAAVVEVVAMHSVHSVTDETVQEQKYYNNCALCSSFCAAYT